MKFLPNTSKEYPLRFFHLGGIIPGGNN